MKRIIKKLSAVLLCLMVAATMTPATGFAADGDAGLKIQKDGETITELNLPKNASKKDSVEIQVAGASGDVQWQYYASEFDTWVSISGETKKECALTYAKVFNMLDDEDSAKIRCIEKDGDTTNKSDAVTLTVVEAEKSDSTTTATKGYSLKNSASSATPKVLSEGTSTYDLGGNDNNAQTTYNVVINYNFVNGDIVADPYTASLAAGSSFSATVTFPTVQGYLPYIGEAQKDSIELNYTNIDQDYSINVVYKPTNVDYTVIHYKQNVDNDNYTVADRETKQGLTGSTVPEVAKVYTDEDDNVVTKEGYEGFYALLYEKPAIAADGSTVVEVYYDRYYYLMNFDLDGGYGVEPIYARYGSTIGDVGTPTKAGYTFDGWSLDGTTAVDLPNKMPAENRTYKAIWTANDTAKVTVVFWGENADDEEYSYIKSTTIDVKPGTKFTYSEDGSLVCALEEHTHSVSDCYELTCTQEEHTHSDGCYTACGLVSHTHDKNCYAGVGTQSAFTPYGAPTNPSEGEVYQRNNNSNKYIYINGKWYRYSGTTTSGNIAPTTCGKEEHTHTDACLGCGKTEHTHSIENGCYELTCGKTEHTHTSDCYMSGAGLDSSLWTFVKSDTVEVAADGSSVVNVYYDRTTFTLTFRANNNTVATITDKWGAEISSEFDKAPFNTTYNGRAWRCTDSSKYSYALQTLDRMPQFDATFDLYNKSSNTLKTIYYYVENVGANVSANNWPNSTENFTLLKSVQTYFNYATYDEEYHEIEGYTRYSASVAGFNDNSKAFSNNTLYLYYMRNDYTLTFNDGYSNVKVENVEYQQALDSYESYVPETPSAYEPGSVTFGGWYLNPQCTGNEYVLSEHTMPLGNLILYAKWVPISHTVEFYLDKDALDAGNKLYKDVTVNHGALVEPTPADPTKGSYTFVGWFYMEDGVEKAFDFANMPIRKDLKVYGKWSSNVLKEYTIYYKIQGTDTEIATPTKGSALAGATKTFEAKGGSELNADYQEGYFPVVKSHSLTLDIDDASKNVYTFEYVQKESVPYTVKYLNKETGEPVADEKAVSDNRKAVVTETFVPVSGMMPDAYQKRLVVSAEEGAVNEIIFYYEEDTTHAYYKITHYTENLATDADGNPTWTEYASSQAVGDIGTTYTAEPMTIAGFTYDSTVTGTIASGELTASGLELKLYYTRNSYPYQVRYLEQGTGKQLAEPKNGTGKYGQIVSESAKEIANYTAVDPTSQTLNIRIEEDRNIITFYYTEKTATYTYNVVGPEGCGSVSLGSEVIKVLTGTAQGSTPSVLSDSYRFVGWYTDADCTKPVESSLVDEDNKLTPVQDNDGVYKGANYYAKFEYALADLTINKSGISSVDHHKADSTGNAESQSTIFRITEVTEDGSPSNYSQDVVICGNGSVTIKDLKIGTTYTVTELTNWSWRYTPKDGNAQVIKKIEPSGNTVDFVNVRAITGDKSKWLNGGAYCENAFDAFTGN